MPATRAQRPLAATGESIAQPRRPRETENKVFLNRVSLVAQLVKNLPTVQETQVRSLGQEDPLEKEMAAHSRILVWKTSWTEEPGGLQSMGLQRVGHR